jgi:hypothetical protein
VSPSWHQVLLGQSRSLNSCHRKQQLHCQLDLPAALQARPRMQIQCRRRPLQQIIQLQLTCHRSMDTLTVAAMRLAVTTPLAVQPVAQPQVTITVLKALVQL